MTTDNLSIRTHIQRSSTVATACSPWFVLIAAGYLLRVAVMPLMGQHDVMFMAWQAHYLAQGHLNLYAYLHRTFGDIVVQRVPPWAPYPYGYYTLTAAWQVLLDRIGLISLQGWDRIWEVAHPARSVFLFKLAYLPFDFAIGCLLLWAGGGRRGMMAWALWAWSPIALYTPFLMGQNDIYATACMVAGLCAATCSLKCGQTTMARVWPDRWALLAALLLGIGSTLKIFPLLLLPPLALLLSDRWRFRLAFVGLGSLVFTIGALPFINTPAFVQSVLMNQEGGAIFREVQFFSRAAPLFLVVYMALLMVLSVRSRPATQADDVWLVGLIVLGALFLMVSTVLYWLIWLVPLLVIVGSRNRSLLCARLVLELAFVGILFTQHRELAVALPLHLSPEFSLPNLYAAMSVTHPILAQGAARIWAATGGAYIASLVMTLGWAAWLLWKREMPGQGASRHKVGPLLAIIPALTLFAGLTANVHVARNMVFRFARLSWDSTLTLSTENQVVTEIVASELPLVTGVVLRASSNAGSGARLQVCLYPAGDARTQSPLACATGGLVNEAGTQYLYVLFAQPVRLEHGCSYALRIQLETPDTTVLLPYSTSGGTGTQVQFADKESPGTLDYSFLRPFSARTAFGALVLRDIGGDPWLVLLMVATALASIAMVALIWARWEYARYQVVYPCSTVVAGEQE